MSQAPTDAIDSESTNQYGQSWTDTLNLVRSGSSWSGRERNCVFLNLSSSPSDSMRPFANVSAVSGLDFKDDARAVAVIDWDHDGDLDLWIRNRTEPRLRLLLNHANDGSDANFVSVTLRGRDGHPDAIGGVATFVGNHDKLPVAQAVRCGDGFISQSSQRLHFGLGDNSQGNVNVRWPGGHSDTFEGLLAGQHYLLEEGSGVASESPLPVSRPADSTFSSTIRKLTPTAAARIVLPARLPFPTIRWLDAEGEDTDSPFDPSTSATLVVFWTNTCPVCRRELKAIRDLSAEFATRGLSVIGVNVDSLMVESELPATTFADDDSLPHLSMQTDDTSITRLKAVQNAIFDKHPPFVVPQSYLLDQQGAIVAMYRGEIEMSTVFADMKLTTADNFTKRSHGLPVDGVWFTKPATDSEFAENVAKRIFPQDWHQGVSYFGAAIRSALHKTRKSKLQTQYVSTVRRLAKTEGEQGNFVSAQVLLRQALLLADDPSRPVLHHDLGVFLAATQEYKEAEQCFMNALRLQPNYAAAQKKLTLVRQKILGGQ